MLVDSLAIGCSQRMVKRKLRVSEKHKKVLTFLPNYFYHQTYHIDPYSRRKL